MSRTVRWTALFLFAGSLNAGLPNCAWSKGAGQAATASQVPILSERQASRLLLVRKKPNYPAIAKINFIQGRVILRVIVGKGGKVVRAHVLKGFPLLAAAALEAVDQWRYRPFIESSGPSAFQTTVRVDFSLHLHGDLFFRNWTMYPSNTPANPDGDFERQVRPPQVLMTPGQNGNGRAVQMRLLLDENGHVLDSLLLGGSAADFKMANEAVRQWKFEPAHWGTLAIPWPVEVEVPVGEVSHPSQHLLP